MRFEVFLPAEGEEGFDVTLKLEAQNWMAALRGALAKLGPAGAEMRNIVCDIQADNTIHVTDPVTRRTFRIRELAEEEPVVAPAAFDASSTIPEGAGLAEEARRRVAEEEAARARESAAAAEAEAARRAARARESAAAAEAEAARRAAAEAEAAARQAAAKTEAARRAEAEAARRAEAEAARHAEAEAARQAEAARKKAAAEAEAARRDAERQAKAARKDERKRELEKKHADEARATLEAQQRKAAEKRTPTLPPSDVKFLSVEKSSPRIPSLSGVSLVRPVPESADELLAAIFDEMMDLELSNLEAPGAADLALRIAKRYIDAESGSVLVADINSGELYFAAAFGPKAAEVKKFRIQMGQGIAGFAAREGFAVAVGSAPQDPRYFNDISEQIGYEARSIICVPMLHDGRSFGCVELINRRGRDDFSPDDLSALSYIGTKLAEYLSLRVGTFA